jgi:O-antigen/teichoic acid export membrane protein
MLVENAERPAMTEAAAHRATFFRQSGWLMLANIFGGFLMFGVHPLARAIGRAEYGLFGTLLMSVALVPGGPLQMVLTHQTARALATHRERELSGIIRTFAFGLFCVWVVGCLAVLLFQNRILRLWGVSNPTAVWMTLPVVLFSLLAPVFQGTLQGQQNFLWLGWSMLSSGIGRLAIAALLVLGFGAGALGMMAGVLAGILFAIAIAIWQTRALWRLPSLPFNWPSLLRQVLPLLLGFVLVQFLFTSDTMFVRHYFTENETGSYVAAGTLSRAVMWLVFPLATVMFPRIVHSTARSEKTDIMGVVLLGTAILALGAVAGLTVLGPWVVKLVGGESFVAVAAAVLPWYALAMVPLALANVLVNNLLALSRFRVVPFLLLLAIAYAGTLVWINQHGHSLRAVLQTLGVFNLLLLGICAWFTWGTKEKLPVPLGSEE